MTHAQVIHGDCLEVISGMDAESVDAVVTDPPYIVGGISVGNASAKSGTWADMENSAFWYAAWMKECFRVLKPTGHLLCFGSWRTLPTLMRALSLNKRIAHSCLVWDKQWIGPGHERAFRPRWELVIHSGMNNSRIDDRSQADVLECKWMAGNCKTTSHPAEKPIELMRTLVRCVSSECALVLDPFCGSGTTGVACIKEKRRFVGIEREAEYVEIARARIAGCALPLMEVVS